MANPKLQEVIFKQKTFASILEEVYDNQQNKKEEIRGLISEIQPFIKSINDAAILVPIIQKYLEIDSKNDEILIRMSTIIKDVLKENGITNEDLGFNLDDMEALQSEVQKISQFN